MTVEQLKIRIESLAAGTKAQITDLTGTQNHFQAVVVSPAFADLTPVEQHRLIFQILQTEIKSDEVHALSLKTYTPDQFAKL